MATAALREFERYLYSMFRIATPAAVPVPIVIAPGDYSVFGTAKGGTGQGFATSLTDRETNLDTAGQIPQEISFVTREVGFAIYGGLTPSGIRRLAERIATEVETASWKLLFGTMNFYPGGIGISGLSNIAGEQAGSIGMPQLIARRKMNQVLIFRGGSTISGHFRVTSPITIPPVEQVPGEAIDLVWMFYGRSVTKERLERMQRQQRPAAAAPR